MNVPEGYETLEQASTRLGLSSRTLRNYALAGRLNGAVKSMLRGVPVWVVPCDSAVGVHGEQGYESVSRARVRLGLSKTQMLRRLQLGQVPGAYLGELASGARYWCIPVDAQVIVPPKARPKPRRERKQRDRAQAWRQVRTRYPRCDVCGILLERSGDGRHANDAPDAGRCWSCRADYGAGAVAEAIMVEEVIAA